MTKFIFISAFQCITNCSLLFTQPVNFNEEPYYVKYWINDHK